MSDNQEQRAHTQPRRVHIPTPYPGKREIFGDDLNDDNGSEPQFMRDGMYSLSASQKNTPQPQFDII